MAESRREGSWEVINDIREVLEELIESDGGLSQKDTASFILNYINVLTSQN